jgi:hypothetical protein
MTLYGGKMNAARLKQVGSITEEAIIRLHKWVSSYWFWWINKSLNQHLHPGLFYPSIAAPVNCLF